MQSNAVPASQQQNNKTTKGNEFQSNWATPAEQKGVLQYGVDFMTQLAPAYTGAS